jgi:hypothetical protein
MKLAIRVFVLLVVLAGLSAATLSAPNAVAATNQGRISASFPIPFCGPWVACTGKPPVNIR